MQQYQRANKNGTEGGGWMTLDVVCLFEKPIIKEILAEK